MNDLCLYAAMQAWVSLRPEKSGATNGELYGDDLPDVSDDWAHLLEWWEQAGTCTSGINGAAEIPHTEIESWARSIGVPLMDFEHRALFLMSRSFARVASDKDAACPMDDGRVAGRIEQANIASWFASAEVPA